MTSSSSIAIIMATLADSRRAALIKRAIASVRNASRQPISSIVVVNGNKYDESICVWLKSQPDVEFAQLNEGSLPRALAHGRKLVKSEFFGFLDDDDEYLPDSLDKKLAVLRQPGDPDLVISNGFRDCDGSRSLFHPAIDTVESDPLGKLFNGNWLPSCGALYRTSSIALDFFENLHPYAEWTWLAFRLSLAGKRIKAVDAPCFVINDTPGSLSKSADFRTSYFALYSRMLEERPPPQIARTIRKGISSAWHDASVDALANRKYLQAIKYHLRSLAYPGGARYLSYTRRLIPGLNN